MDLKHKLKELRTSRGMTQEAVAECLGVSSQTVSKWERGLLSPDISLLPRIALLYKCSIDSLFDMELAWGIEHRREFEANIHALHEQGDWEGVYRAWIREIELNPDQYRNYPDVMLHVFRKKLYKKEYVEKMISLAEHAEKCCTDDDMRNEIYRVMLQLCSESDDRRIKEKGNYYYRKLPQLRHSREVYAAFVMEGEEYRAQMKKNLIYQIDGAECCVRQLITPDMPPEERLFYYQKAAALYEVVLDGRYAGFYDPPLLYDYLHIALIYAELGQPAAAAEYVERIFAALERHLTPSAKEDTSVLLYATTLKNAVPTEQILTRLLQTMLEAEALAAYRERISGLVRRWNEQSRKSTEGAT